MTDDSGVRQVTIHTGTNIMGDPIDDRITDDPNGTHHLAPIDDYVVVRREVWERAVSALRVVVGVYDDPPLSMTSSGGMKDVIDIARRALAEIGEVKGEK